MSNTQIDINDWIPAEGKEISDYEAECITDISTWGRIVKGKKYRIFKDEGDKFRIHIIFDGKPLTDMFFKTRFAIPTLIETQPAAAPAQIENCLLLEKVKKHLQAYEANPKEIKELSKSLYYLNEKLIEATDDKGYTLSRSDLWEMINDLTKNR